MARAGMRARVVIVLKTLLLPTPRKGAAKIKNGNEELKKNRTLLEKVNKAIKLAENENRSSRNITADVLLPANSGKIRKPARKSCVGLWPKGGSRGPPECLTQHRSSLLKRHMTLPLKRLLSSIFRKATTANRSEEHT